MTGTPSAPRKRTQIGETGQTVAANLRRLRQARQLSTRNLAAKLTAHGCPIQATAITRIELCERQVNVDELAAFAVVLDAEATVLLAPYTCATCHGAPPAGYICASCGSAEAAS